jgi:hypothetical protein
LSDRLSGHSQLLADDIPLIATGLGISPCAFYDDERERNERMNALIREQARPILERRRAERGETEPSLGQELAADALAVAAKVPEAQLRQFLDFLAWQAERADR